MKKEKLVRRLADAGFACECCGACCSGADNEVIVTPDEIDVLVRVTGLLLDDIAEPYPEWFEEHGERFTFSWILKRGADGNCRFLRDKKCTVYANRPDICRTYPFMLNRGKLIVSACPGLGKHTSEDAVRIADDLILREWHDNTEFAATRETYQKHSIISGARLVIDSRGVHILQQ